MSNGKGNKIAAEYMQENFEPADRLAIVLVKKSEGAAIQRLASASAIADAHFQDELWEANLHRYEIYVSMNALHPEAQGRTKRDVQTVRHLYLDFDEDGTSGVERLLKRDDLPQPNYLLNSSPGRSQVIWKVSGFATDEAEVFQRGLARETGADSAATDCSRVLRLPGYYNHKYGTPHLVSADRLATEAYRADRFPRFLPLEWHRPPASENGTRAGTGRHRLSQSEIDWAFAKRALARGESPALVAAAIAQYRRYDKHDPNYYAELTVRKAAEALREGTERNNSPAARLYERLN